MAASPFSNIPVKPATRERLMAYARGRETWDATVNRLLDEASSARSEG